MYQPKSILSAIAQINSIDAPIQRTVEQEARNAEHRAKLVSFLMRQEEELLNLLNKFSHLSIENTHRWHAMLKSVRFVLYKEQIEIQYCIEHEKLDRVYRDSNGTPWHLCELTHEYGSELVTCEGPFATCPPPAFPVDLIEVFEAEEQ